MSNQPANYLLNSILAESNRWEWNLDRQLTLLGVSGGRDSTAMLLAFAELKFPVIVGHVNFGLRGEDSDGDAEFVRELCDKLEVKCFILNVKDSKSGRFEMRSGESTQVWARRVRYDFFQEIMLENGAVYLAVAHHLQDHFEHLFIYLSRGQNHHAFSGMRIQNGKLIRPMLKVKPSSIVEFLKHRGVVWREDASNASLKYLRNKVRWGIVTPLLAENEALLDEFLESSQHFQVSFDEISQQFELKWPRKDLKKGFCFKADDRWTYWGVLDDFMRGLGFTSSDVEQIFGSSSKVGALRETGNYVMCKERNSQILVFEKLDIDELYEDWRINVPRQWKEKNLEIRQWQQGDKIKIALGNKMITKKISDVFVDLKWNRLQKQRCRILVVDGEIMAVEGALMSWELQFSGEIMVEIVVHGKNIG